MTGPRTDSVPQHDGEGTLQWRVRGTVQYPQSVQPRHRLGPSGSFTSTTNCWTHELPL